MLRLLRALLSNIVLFSVALAAAIAIWFIAQQDADPINTQLWPISIEIIGKPADGRILSQEHDTVQVLVQGPNSALAELSADKFSAYIDLSQQSYGTLQLPIEVTVNVEGVNMVARTPEETTIELEQLINREIPVVIEPRINVATGYRAGEPIVSPSKVVVNGPANRVNNLGEARVTVFLENARETRTFSLRPFYYDNEGSIANTTGLSFDTNFVQVTVPIEQLEGVANKPITVDWVGEPATGYRLLNMTVEPNSVLVTGLPDQLDSLRLLTTEPVDITGLRASDTQQVALDLPDGITLLESQPFFVTIEIDAIRVSSVVERPLEIRALGENLVASVDKDEIRVFLFGPLATLDSLQEADVRVTLDLLNLEPGVYDLEPTIAISAGDIEIRSVQPALIKVTIESIVDLTDSITDTVSITNTVPITTIPPYP